MEKEASSTKATAADGGGVPGTGSNSSTSNTTSQATLSQAVQKLDEDIVQAINQLVALQTHTPKMKAQHLVDLEKLGRECVQAERRWHESLRQARVSKDSPLHKYVCQEVFAGVSTPAVVAARQTQLLVRLHTMEVLATQTEMLEKHKRVEYVTLEDELLQLQQLQCLNSQRQLSDILALETEIQTLKAKLDDCPQRTDDPATSILARLRKTSEETNTTQDTCAVISDQEEDNACSSSPSGRQNSPRTWNPEGKMRLRFWNPFGSPRSPPETPLTA